MQEACLQHLHTNTLHLPITGVVNLQAGLTNNSHGVLRSADFLCSIDSYIAESTNRGHIDLCGHLQSSTLKFQPQPGQVFLPDLPVGQLTEEPFYEYQHIRAHQLPVDHRSSAVSQVDDSLKEALITQPADIAMTSTIGNNLSELDQLLQDLNSAQFLTDVNHNSSIRNDSRVSGGRSDGVASHIITVSYDTRVSSGKSDGVSSLIDTVSHDTRVSGGKSDGGSSLIDTVSYGRTNIESYGQFATRSFSTETSKSSVAVDQHSADHQLKSPVSVDQHSVDHQLKPERNRKISSTSACYVPMTSDGIANESHSVDLYHHHYQQNQHGNLVRAGDRSGDPDVLLPRWGCGGSLTDQQMVLETHRLPSLTSTPLTSPPLTSPPLTSPPLPSPPSRQQSVALQPMADLWRGSSSATKELDQLMASLSDFKLLAQIGTPQASQRPPEPAYAKPLKSLSAANSSPTSPNMPPGSASGCDIAVTLEGAADKQGAAALDTLLGHLQSDLSKQGVSAKKKGICAACDGPIIGQVVAALGRTWHVEHFVCQQCRQPLGTDNFYERDGAAYCEPDYHGLFAPRCAHCSQPIVDKYITALDKMWHPEHFFCAQCGRQFGDENFHEKNGQAYCREDYSRMFAPRCGGCAKPIMENYISALTRQWHPQCFCCMECQTPFGAGSFYDVDGLPYCETHYHSKKGSLCASCQKPITGRCITAMFRKFHPEHFVCAYCLKLLNKGTFKEQADKPYCHPCFVKLFG